jgi:glyoxylase-like metal-dependent hydrolase (beta-lactamase superfamily II)
MAPRLTSYLGGARLAAPDVIALGPGVSWYDERLAVEHLDAVTIALAEPRYYQQNTSYLISGSAAALLYDTGTGLADQPTAVAALTSLPVIATCSHFHYDHVGNLGGFADVALFDHPRYRAALRNGRLRPPWRLHLGALEAMPRPLVRPTRWLEAGAEIDLGGRRLLVIPLPGHSADGMGLYDPAARQAFVGDFIYPGGAYAFTPTGALKPYEQAAAALLELTDPDTTYFVAHPGRVSTFTTPRMTRADVEALHRALQNAIDNPGSGRGWLLRRYAYGQDASVIARAPWLRP